MTTDTPTPITPEQIRAIRGEEMQTNFARRLGATPTTVSRWENGASPPAPVFLRALRRLARKRGVTLEATDAKTDVVS